MVKSGKRIRIKKKPVDNPWLGLLFSVVCVFLFIIVFAVFLRMSGGSADISMNGIDIDLPDGFDCEYSDPNYSVWKYKGSDMKPGQVIFDARIRGKNAQYFGTADEVLSSCDWLSDTELYITPAGIRTARGFNKENKEASERRYYVEGPEVVFVILMIENEEYYDRNDCERAMLRIVDSIRPSGSDNSNGRHAAGSIAGKTPEELVSRMTLQQKAYQMVQPASYNITSSTMQNYCYGSLLSQRGAYSREYWTGLTDRFQENALASAAGIPYLYGNDDVHGVNYCRGAVIFPHNIGIGAADDPVLTRRMGLAVANEALLCHLPWNFAPCVARSVDPRWGRTYESYGSDLDLIRRLGCAYVEGLSEGGVIACAKHFLGDGDVVYGTGEDSRLIDRGDAEMSDEEIEAEMDVYRSLILSGAKSIMISHSSLNGTKMHENSDYILRLKEETCFEGFVVSDWNAVQNIPDADYENQIVKAVNAGIDMLMEPDSFNTAANLIVRSVQKGTITQSRVDDAVTRILRVKQQAGILDDPFLENLTLPQADIGSTEYRLLAEQLVEESLVLLKNDRDILPLKSGTTVYVTGPAADNASAQCGGWTLEWNGAPYTQIPGVTTIAEGLKKCAAEHNIRIVTDPEQAASADAVLLCIGEKPYAEWLGDTPDPTLYGTHSLIGNYVSIESVRKLNKPVIALIIAGRHVYLSDSDLDSWSGAVMCYLPGSEGCGIARVLFGEVPFTGRLPSPWYRSNEEIGTGECRWDTGYGLFYKNSADVQKQ